jgi:hypothetical protein
MRKAIGIFAVIIIIAALFWYAYETRKNSQIPSTDYKNATYSIEGEPVTLVNGYAETEVISGSASKTITQYFGNEATGDLNGDGLPDIAFLLSQNGAGSGTFFYVVAALNTGDGYRGTNAILLGDRIAPQSTELQDGVIEVDYAVRKPEDSMAVEPSIGTIKFLKLQGSSLKEIR